MHESITNSLVGIPYELHGRDRSGCDCWGIVRLWLNEAMRMNVPSYVEKTTAAWPTVSGMTSFFDEVIGASWEKVDIGQEQIGDVAWIRSGRWPVHVGVIVSNGLLLHSEGPKRQNLSRVEQISSLNLKTRVLGFWRYQQGERS
jgi:cell wall-associated NlpC family hydrolase